MGILALILVEEFFGYERWKIVCHFSECFLGTRPKVEMQKFIKGGERKRPPVCPLRTSVKRFCSRMSGFKLAQRRLGLKERVLGPE